jgi:formylglycine-generating enzyme required for sulfatase activity
LALMICQAALAAAPVAPGQWSSLDREPYTRWTTHTGSAEEAVVHVRVSLKDAETGETEVREGSGFVVRCDGFVMVPTALLSPAMTTRDGQTRNIPRETIQTTLTFVAADGPIPPPQSAPHPRLWTQSEPLGFALSKLNDLHFKGIPLLDPQNVRENMAVEVVYAVPAPGKAGKAEAVAVSATVGKAMAGRARFAFAGSAPRVPPGALVIDAKSRLALGIVPGTAREGEPLKPASHFLSFAGFHRISNVVGLQPVPGLGREPDEAAAGTPAGQNGDMIRVPGGPVVLTGQSAKDYVALYGKWVVCTPSFWIDKRPVTNEEYREFLVATNYPRLPKDWSDPRGWSNQPISAWWRELPVIGVSAEDAQAYAAWCGKRLPTPAEWARASAGAETRVHEYLDLVNEAKAVLDRRLTELDVAEREQLSLAAARLRQRGAVFKGRVTGRTEETNEIERNKLELEAGFNAAYQYPLQLVPAGWREPDQSVWGVRDVAMNANEHLQPNLALRATDITWKQLPAILGTRSLRSYQDTYKGDPMIVFLLPRSEARAPRRRENGVLEYEVYGTGAYAPRVRLENGMIWYPDLRIGVPAYQCGFRCAR